MSHIPHTHYPEKYYLTVPFAEFPKRFGTHNHPTPRHMTIVPYFRLARHGDIGLLMDAVGQFCAQQESFNVTFGAVEGYGEKENELGQPVIAGKERVIELHMGLLAVVSEWATVIDDRWCAERFSRPHSSLHGEDLFDGSPVGVWSVLAVGRYVKDQHRINDPDRELSAGFRLGGKIRG